MKRLLVAATALILTASFANAQEGKPDKPFKGDKKEMHGGPHKKGDKHGKHGKGKMKHDLNFSEEQKKQAKAYNEDFKTKMTALRSNDKMTMGEFKKQSLALQKQRKQNMQSLLTTEQKTKLADDKKKRQEETQVRGAARMERMKINLGLEDEQVAKLKKQREEFHTKMKAIHEDESLLPEQKKEKGKLLAEENKNNLKSVLTPEQLEKFNNRKKQRA